MRHLTFLAAFFPYAAFAEVPQVVTDIAPVHSLTAQVMAGVGAPVLLLDASMSPHHANLRPSQAGVLQDADVIFMIGAELTPWLPDMIASLARDARAVPLLDLAPVLLGPGRPGDVNGDIPQEIENDPHAHREHAHDDHADHDGDHEKHEDHEGHAEHEDHAGHEEHKEHAEHEDHEEHKDHDDHAGHEGHAHAIDPHAWLDIDNAKAWLAIIADTLSEADPENAALYRSNADRAAQQLGALSNILLESAAPGRAQAFLAYHDAYSYFARRQGYLSLGSIASNEGVAPSAADLRRAQELIEGGRISCVFTEAQFSDKVVFAVADGKDVPLIELDPLGAAHSPGPALYTALIEDMAADFEACIADPS